MGLLRFVCPVMEAVKNLTQNSVVLKNGNLIYDGDTASAVNQYLRNNDLKHFLQFETKEEAIGNEFIKVKSVQLKYEGDILSIDKEINIEIQYWNLTNFNELVVGFDLIHISGITVLSTGKAVSSEIDNLNRVTCIIPANFLNNDIYSINLMFLTKNIMPLYVKPEIITFEVEDIARDSNHTGKINGVVRPQLIWE